uniref:Immunoglobulin V-set domain-containing protein n=1 Tax=Scophthalmus maximus TaxID=52904 RepID=A0A8D3BNL3_SCOMX
IYLLNENVELVCVLSQRCVLPCTFTPGGEEVVHWVQLKEGIIPVHSYYRDQDQLSGQNQRFRNRTSLFRDKISGGNASLQLTGLQLQDQGRYNTDESGMNGLHFVYFVAVNIILYAAVAVLKEHSATQKNKLGFYDIRSYLRTKNSRFSHANRDISGCVIFCKVG